MTRGGIANWHTGSLLGLLHHGLPKMGKNPVKTGNLSVSTMFNINPCDSVCIGCSAHLFAT